MSQIDQFLKRCQGIEHKVVERKDYRGNTVYDSKFYLTGDASDVAVLDDVFIEIVATATNGTIGKVVDIEIKTYEQRYPSVERHRGSGEISTFDTTFIYEAETADGKVKKGRIGYSYANVLEGNNHQTKYVRNIKTHNKEEVKNPVNKYKQELQKGDWVFGVKPGKRLGIGRITRWTNHNVWGTMSDDLDDRKAEFKFDSISETFTAPDSEAVQQMLTMAILKGYKGR